MDLFFLNFFGSRVLVDEVRREAGENPALPRNCKRGNSQPVTGEILGRPVVFVGQSEHLSSLASQETGANRPHQPLSRVKGGVHAVLSYSGECDLLLLAAASAAEIKVKVVDPQSAVVAGAQVTLFPRDSATPAAVGTTSAEGLVVFRGIASNPYQVRVLAPGFAAKTVDLLADRMNRSPWNSDLPRHPKPSSSPPRALRCSD